MSRPFRFVGYRELQQFTIGSWQGFRLYLLVIGPSLVVELASFRRPTLGASVIVFGMAVHYLVACSISARREPH